MGEPTRSTGIKSKAPLRLVRRSAILYGDEGHTTDTPTELRPFPTATVDGAVGDRWGTHARVRDCSDHGCLIFSRDTVISRRLQEQTRVVLALLTPREQWVLRLRFGIAQTGDHPLEMIDEVLTPVQMAFIEATALRKLRHPSQAARLRSIDRG